MNTSLGLYRFVSVKCPNTYWVVLTDDLMFFEHKHVHQLGWVRAEADEIDLESEYVRPLIC